MSLTYFIKISHSKPVFNIWKQIKNNMYLIRNSEYKSQDQIPVTKIPSLTSSQVIAVFVSVHFYKVLGDMPILVRTPDGYPT